MQKITEFLAPAALALGLILTGCAHTAEESLENTVYISPQIKTVLPKLEAKKPFSLRQLLKITHQDEVHQILVLLEGARHSLHLCVLSPSGIRLYDAWYEEGSLKQESLINLKELPPPGQVLFDIMLTMPDNLNLSLPQNALLKDEGLHRELTDEEGNALAVIDFAETGGIRVPLKLERPVFGYKIEFTTL